MRKSGVFAVVAAVSLMFSLGVFAQAPVKADDSAAIKTDSPDKKSCPFDKEMKMKGPMMMGPMMMAKQMVATSDGGVVILVGNKLIKYDKSLNLVKETEIKINMEEMAKMRMEREGKHHMGMKNRGEKEEFGAPDMPEPPERNMPDHP